MFSRDIPKEFLFEIGKQDFQKENIKKRELLNLGLNCALEFDISYAESYVYIFLAIIKIFVVLGVMFLVILPYFIQISPILVLIFTFYEKDYVLFSISLVDTIFSSVSFLSIYGFFVCCCCLYHPSNWILFAALSDLISIISELYIGYRVEKGSQERILLYLFFHIPIIFYNLIKQVYLYIIFKKVYKKIREKEALIIKKCIEALVKEKNLYKI